MVHFDVTGDAVRREVPAADPVPQADPAPDAAALAAARALVAGARRPIVIAGVEAAADPALADSVRRFAAACGCPALVTYKAKGVIADDDPAFVGHFTGGSAEAAAVGEADLILLAGLDPVELIPQAWRYRAPVIEIARRAFPVRYVEPAAGLYGAPAAALAALVPDGRSAWTADAIARHRDAMRARLAWTGQGR